MHFFVIGWLYIVQGCDSFLFKIHPWKVSALSWNREACIRFMELWKRKHETGQWLEIEATEAMSCRSDFSSMNASGIVISHGELGVDSNGKANNDASGNMNHQHLSSDPNSGKLSVKYLGSFDRSLYSF